MPYFNFCNIIWASTKPTRLDHLVKLQKQAIRIICGVKYRQHTLPLFYFFKVNNLQLLTYKILNIAVFVYGARHCKLPALFQNFFVLNSKVHEHLTRRCGNLHIQYARTDLYKSQLQIYEPKLWNEIDQDIIASPHLQSFKGRFKKYLLNLNVNIIVLLISSYYML